MPIRKTILTILGASAIALSGCSTPTMDELIADLRHQRDHANHAIQQELKEQAEQDENKKPETALEQAIERRHNLEIIGHFDEKTDERLNKINERFNHYRSLFGPNTSCHAIYILPIPDTFEHWRIYAGSMGDGNMSIYGKFLGKTIMDHEYTHARQHDDPTTHQRLDQLVAILQTTGNEFRNEDYNKDKNGIWQDGTSTPKEYFITPYSCKNPHEYEAELYQEAAQFFRGERTNLTSIDTSLPLWPKIFTLLKGNILPEPWAQTLTAYVTDQNYHEALDAARNWNMNLEDTAILATFNNRYNDDSLKPLYSTFKNHVLFKNEEVRDLAFANPKAALFAHKITTELPMLAGTLHVRNQRAIGGYSYSGPLDFFFMLNEYLQRPERVKQYYEQELKRNAVADR